MHCSSIMSSCHKLPVLSSASESCSPAPKEQKRTCESDNDTKDPEQQANVSASPSIGARASNVIIRKNYLQLLLQQLTSAAITSAKMNGWAVCQRIDDVCSLPEKKQKLTILETYNI